MAKLNDLLGGDQLKFLCNVVRKHESARTLMYTINVIKCMCMQLDCISAKKIFIVMTIRYLYGV